MHGIARIQGQVAPRLRIWFPALGLFLTACASGQISGGAYINEAKGFVVQLPLAGWDVETHKEPDLLLRHASRHAGISIHATCGTIPPDRPLEIASRHLFLGIQRKQLLRQERHAASREEMLEVVLRGEVERRELLLHGYTMKRPGCVYDLVLFAAAEDYSAVNGEFEALVQSFRQSLPVEGRTR
ncbi:MAG: hypothetical protein HY729_07995 [Candidatus Rokubacteria bacterium]|nr:hypothetical protein [Candidatus Rokubacteria bacterium]